MDFMYKWNWGEKVTFGRSSCFGAAFSTGGMGSTSFFSIFFLDSSAFSALGKRRLLVFFVAGSETVLTMLVIPLRVLEGLDGGAATRRELT
jgi:hypothetical protein